MDIIDQSFQLNNFMNNPVRTPLMFNNINSHCTIESFGKNYIQQQWYNCLTCYNDDTTKGCCIFCMLKCHKGHNLIGPNYSNFFCDCNCTSNHGSNFPESIPNFNSNPKFGPNFNYFYKFNDFNSNPNFGPPDSNFKPNPNNPDSKSNFDSKSDSNSNSNIVLHHFLKNKNDLLSTICKGNLYSPLSTYQALYITQLGTSKETKQELVNS